MHDIDLMMYVLGEWPGEVFTSANAFSPEIHKLQDYDNVVSTFKFAFGIDHTYICLLIILCMHSHGPVPWTVLFEKKIGKSSKLNFFENSFIKDKSVDL